MDAGELEGALDSLFSNEYVTAKQVYLRADVYRYKRSQLALIEFEHALTHIGLAIEKRADARAFEYEIVHAKKHLCRLAIEVQEELSEDLLLRIRRRIDPTFRRPWLGRLLLIPPTQLSNETVRKLNEAKEMIARGRNLKGNKDRFQECLGHFLDAWNQLISADSEIKDSPYWQRLFSVILAVLSVTVGFILGRLVK